MTEAQTNYLIASASYRQAEVAERLAEETKRHNEASEDIARQQNQIAADRAQNEYVYNMFKAESDARISELRVEYEHADRSRQLEISAEMTNIQSQLASAEVDYKSNVAWYNKENARLQGELNQITSDYNDAKAILEEHSQYIQQQKVDLQNQSLEWQKTYDAMNLQLSAAKIKNETLRTQLLGYEQQFEIIKYQDTGRDVAKSTVIRNIFGGVGDVLRGVTSLLNKPAKGGNHGTTKPISGQETAKEEWFNLFSE